LFREKQALVLRLLLPLPIISATSALVGVFSPPLLADRIGVDGCWTREEKTGTAENARKKPRALPLLLLMWVLLSSSPELNRLDIEATFARSKLADNVSSFVVVVELFAELQLLLLVLHCDIERVWA
jgi:hypothetical protein